MKKNLALLLAVILVFTSLLGLTAAAEGGAKATAPSLEVEYTNVSLKVGATLLFAVPSAGHYIQADGTVDGLRLLVFEQSGANGVFAVADAMKSGEVLEASGHMEINGKDYIIFSYSGLAASQMTETVYFRTIYTYGGKRVYGDIGTYSVAEFAKRYPANGQYASLVNSMLKYGDAAAEAYNVATNFKASEAKDLLTIKVKRVLDGVALDDAAYTTQLVKSGVATTLEIPFVDGATYTSVSGATLSSGKITVTKDTELTINYETKAPFTNYDMQKGAVGSYISTDYAKNPTTGLTEFWASNADKKSFEGGSYNIGNNYNFATANALGYAAWKIEGTDTDKYMKWTHNGVGQVSFGSMVLADRTKTSGLGDTLGYTFEIDLKTSANGTFPYTSIMIDRVGNTTATNGNAGGGINLAYLNQDGSVTLDGPAVKYGDIETNVVAEKISSTEFQKLSVYYDPTEQLFFGYLDGELKAVAGLNPVKSPDAMNAAMDYGLNIRYGVVMYGGVNAGNWTGKGFPQALVDAGLVSFTKVENPASGVVYYVVDKDSGLYRTVDPTSEIQMAEYEGAERYSISYTKSADLRAAVIECAEANDYFYYDNVLVNYGHNVSK